MDDIVFTAKDVEITLFHDQVRGLYFTHLDDPNGIDAVTADDGQTVRYDITAQRIRVSGLQSGESVNVFGLGGSMLATAKADGNGKVEIGLSGTSGMVYVVKVGNRSFKLTIK